MWMYVASHVELFGNCSWKMRTNFNFKVIWFGRKWECYFRVWNHIHGQVVGIERNVTFLVKLSVNISHVYVVFWKCYGYLNHFEYAYNKYLLNLNITYPPLRMFPYNEVYLTKYKKEDDFKNTKQSNVFLAKRKIWFLVCICLAWGYFGYLQ